MGGFQPFLLHGVTGSGKTEVYLRAVEHALAQGRGSLVLVPEIALTPQLVGRFRSRFGSEVAVLHSGAQGPRAAAPLAGAAQGRRCASPWACARPSSRRWRTWALVVVDEEHDPSFKQEEKLRYQARDLAVVRAKQAGRGGGARLGHAVAGDAGERAPRPLPAAGADARAWTTGPCPRIELVDLRHGAPARTAAPHGGGAHPVAAAARRPWRRCWRKGQQVILFLNRRGHSTFLLCEVCGAGGALPDVRRVASRYHQAARKRDVPLLRRGAAPCPSSCRECSGPLLRLGIGTERVEAEVAERFPQARVARLDRDAATSGEQLTELLAAFARRELDILVGTQMVAKGHDFPGVTLVCVVMADTSLAHPGLPRRRAHLPAAHPGGRPRGPGEGSGARPRPDLQPGLRAGEAGAGARLRGLRPQELDWRKALAYPPFTRMVAMRIEGSTRSRRARWRACWGTGWRGGCRRRPRACGCWGPRPRPSPGIKGKTRWQLLLKGPTHAALAPAGRPRWRRSLADVPSAVKVVIDVDPGAML